MHYSDENSAAFNAGFLPVSATFKKCYPSRLQQWKLGLYVSKQMSE